MHVSVRVHADLTVLAAEGETHGGDQGKEHHVFGHDAAHLSLGSGKKTSQKDVTQTHESKAHAVRAGKARGGRLVLASAAGLRSAVGARHDRQAAAGRCGT